MWCNTDVYSPVIYNANRQKPDQGSKQTVFIT
jgi:hypothetical protein